MIAVIKSPDPHSRTLPSPPPAVDNPMLPQLDTYDWSEIFGEGEGGNCTAIIPQPAPPLSNISTATFGREDVAHIEQMLEGENDGVDGADGADWIICGQLHDGRWFLARGGCDYTGWCCRASNSGSVGVTKEDIVKFGMTRDERIRFGLATELDDYTNP